MTTPLADFTARAEALAPDFVLQREIGRGGMGIVYLALDVKLDRLVAIKVLPEHLADVPEIRERFLREARTAAKLSHPNVVPIYRADEMHGVVFFVMAYVDGEALGERLALRGTLPPLEAVRLLRDVALALGYAHARGIVHRDIKPENILIERDTERPLVTDFGIARLAEAAPLTATGQVLGTVHYMSPEQVSGEALDGRSDLYSLGVVGFRMLAGRLPFDSATASAVLVAHVTKTPPLLRDVAPQVPVALASVIERCLAKDSAARYASGEALVRALDDAGRDMAGDERGATPAIVSAREAEALWARAAALQVQTGGSSAPLDPQAAPVSRREHTDSESDRRTLTSGYKLTDVRAAAEEAGISGRHIQRAAAELGLIEHTATGGSALDVVDRAPPANRWAGAPMSISYEVVIPREVPTPDFEILVDIINRNLGEPGHVSAIGRSMSWSPTTKNRRLQITIVPRAGRTTIRADERLTALAGGLFGGIVGGAGGGSAGVWFGIGTGVLHSLAAAFGLWGAAIAGAYALARAMFSRQRHARQRELRTLLDQLATYESSQARSLSPGPDGA